ncbi:shootin-1 [Pelodytes ibericus]
MADVGNTSASPLLRLKGAGIFDVVSARSTAPKMSSSEEEREMELISSLKDQAIESYEELKTENVKTKDEYDRVKRERDEAVKKLEEFNNNCVSSKCMDYIVREQPGLKQDLLQRYKRMFPKISETAKGKIRGKFEKVGNPYAFRTAEIPSVHSWLPFLGKVGCEKRRCGVLSGKHLITLNVSFYRGVGGVRARRVGGSDAKCWLGRLNVVEWAFSRSQSDQLPSDGWDCRDNVVSHKVIEEVSFIQNNLEIEKSCRESAEVLASKLNKENKTLKRISMLYMAKLGPEIITEEINLDEDDSAAEVVGVPAVCTSLACQQKFRELQEQSLAVQEEKKTVTSELESLRSKLVDLIEEVNITKKENVMLRKETSDQRKLLQKYNRVSVMAVEEYEVLQTSLEMEKDLRETAEKLAHKMYVEQDALKRQSQLLLQNCAPNEQFLKALEENAKLMQTLEEDRIQHQSKVKELEEQLHGNELHKEIQSLRKQLDLLEEDRKDLEAKRLSSESTIRDLKHSVETLQKRLQQAENPVPVPPPPPPPPPPPAPPNAIQSFMSLIRKKPSISSNSPKKETAGQSGAGSMGVIKQQAVEEMMDRIKKGVHLRPVQQANRSKAKVTADAPTPPAGSAEETKPDETKTSNSAVQELKGMVTSLSSTSGARRVKGLGTASIESELETILRRRKVTTEQDASSRTGLLTSLESKSMPVLGSATNSTLDQKTKCAETNSAEQLFKEKKSDLKVASHLAAFFDSFAKEPQLVVSGFLALLIVKILIFWTAFNAFGATEAKRFTSAETLGSTEKHTKEGSSKPTSDIALQPSTLQKDPDQRAEVKTASSADKKPKDANSSNC